VSVPCGGSVISTAVSWSPSASLQAEPTPPSGSGVPACVVALNEVV
jgi:hypothetical protein